MNTNTYRKVVVFSTRETPQQPQKIVAFSAYLKQSLMYEKLGLRAKLLRIARESRKFSDRIDPEDKPIYLNVINNELSTIIKEAVEQFKVTGEKVSKQLNLMKLIPKKARLLSDYDRIVKLATADYAKKGFLSPKLQKMFVDVNTQITAMLMKSCMSGELLNNLQTEPDIATFSSTEGYMSVEDILGSLRDPNIVTTDIVPEVPVEDVQVGELVTEIDPSPVVLDEAPAIEQSPLSLLIEDSLVKVGQLPLSVVQVNTLIGTLKMYVCKDVWNRFVIDSLIAHSGTSLVKYIYETEDGYLKLDGYGALALNTVFTEDMIRSLASL